jgi:hypothetical protein
MRMRRLAKVSLLGFVVVAITVTGCISDRAVEELTAPFNEMVLNLRCSHNLADGALAFYRKTDRWPRDYAELSNFVAKSEGLLVLEHFERVDFSEKSDRVLQVSFLPADFGATGLTNTMLHFTLSPKDARPN